MLSCLLSSSFSFAFCYFHSFLCQQKTVICSPSFLHLFASPHPLDVFTPFLLFPSHPQLSPLLSPYCFPSPQTLSLTPSLTPSPTPSPTLVHIPPPAHTHHHDPSLPSLTPLTPPNRVSAIIFPLIHGVMALRGRGSHYLHPAPINLTQPT